MKRDIDVGGCPNSKQTQRGNAAVFRILIFCVWRLQVLVEAEDLSGMPNLDGKLPSIGCQKNGGFLERRPTSDFSISIVKLFA
jgi:hypothetical protein